MELSTETNDFRNLYGQDDRSWAIAFGSSPGDRLDAWHAGKAFEFRRSGAKTIPVLPKFFDRLPTGSRFQVSFLLDLDGSFSVWMPGSSEEDAFVVPFEVPRDVEVYVVASTPWSYGEIAIAHTPPWRSSCLVSSQGGPST